MMYDLSTLATAPADPPKIYRGYIADDATGPNDQVEVRIPGYSSSRTFGPSYFMPRPLRDGSLMFPIRNDPCLVALDENEQADIVNWWAEDPTANQAFAARLAAIEAGPEAVHLVSSFLNSWANFDPTNRPVRYYKDRGRVYLAGIMSGGTIGANAFTLPVGYRPDIGGAVAASFAVETNGGVAGFIRIDAIGNVVAIIGSNVFMFLDGIDFKHA